MLSGHSDLQHHHLVVTRTRHSMELEVDTCIQAMKHFYSSQPKSYQGSISGELEIPHSSTITVSTTSLSVEAGGNLNFHHNVAIMTGYSLQFEYIENFTISKTAMFNQKSFIIPRAKISTWMKKDNQ